MTAAICDFICEQGTTWVRGVQLFQDQDGTLPLDVTAYTYACNVTDQTGTAVLLIPAVSVPNTCDFIGSIASGLLTVSSVTSGTLAAGMILGGGTLPNGVTIASAGVAPNTWNLNNQTVLQSSASLYGSDGVILLTVTPSESSSVVTTDLPVLTVAETLPPDRCGNPVQAVRTGPTGQWVLSQTDSLGSILDILAGSFCFAMGA